MTAIGRGALWLLRGRVASALLVCILALSCIDVTTAYRIANPFLALGVVIGIVLAILTGVVLVYRIAVATPSDVGGRVIHVLERYAPLVVINLIVLNILAPLIGAAATLLVNMPFWRTYLTILGSLSAQVLCWLFAVAVAGVIAVAAMRLVDRAARRWPPVAGAIGILDRVVIGVAAAYCVWGAVIAFNGTFDRSPVVQQPGKIVRVWGIPRTSFWWADVRQSAPANRSARVLVLPSRDGANAAALAAGQHVRLHLRDGRFGIPWVESMRLDYEHDIAALVAAVPSATVPRKWLIETLLRDGQWTEAAKQTQVYARYHPSDRAYIKRVVAMLRQAQQSQVAADVSRLIIPVSGTNAR